MAKTVIGLFDNYAQAEACVRDLENSGFTADRISLVATDEAKNYDVDTLPEPSAHPGSAAGTGATVGAIGGGTVGLLAGLGLLAIPGFGPIIAAGPILAAITGAGLGAVTGGLIGALTHLGIPEEEVGYYAEGVRRGGALVTVQSDDDMAQRAADIMHRYHVVNIKERSAAYRQGGFTRFDPNARPFTQEEIARERERYRTPIAASSATALRDDVKSKDRLSTEPWKAGSTPGARPFDTYENDFRNDFWIRYIDVDTGATFEQYVPAYRYGYDLASDPRYRDSDWNTMEAQARRDWELQHEGTWDRFKDVIRYAWNRVRGR